MIETMRAKQKVFRRHRCCPPAFSRPNALPSARELRIRSSVCFGHAIRPDAVRASCRAGCGSAGQPITGWIEKAPRGAPSGMKRECSVPLPLGHYACDRANRCPQESPAG